MGNYIKLVRSLAELNAFKSSNDYVIPSIILVDDNDNINYNQYIPPHDYSRDYLTFEALESGTFAFTNSINYSIDDGETWTSLSANTNTPTINVGDKIMFKATLYPVSSNGIGTFSSTGEFNIMGNIMSLLYGDNFFGQVSLYEKNYAFYNLFNNCTKLINAENLSLPATTLEESCYSNMFSGCTSLTTAPELPATTLEESCYSNMFLGCSSLIAAPELPATKLVKQCYCYMFLGCKNLNNITCLATNMESGYTDYWVSGVAVTGTFTKAASMNDWSHGDSGIPNGWTVENA